MDKTKQQILYIPIWAPFTHIPSVLQAMFGLNWLANIVGKLKCFDANIVACNRLVYIRTLIEASSDKPLPSKIPVRIAEGYIFVVDVHYSWKPNTCTSCQSFGYLMEACSL